MVGFILGIIVGFILGFFTAAILAQSDPVCIHGRKYSESCRQCAERERRKD